jgi:hypothetical protein
MENQLVPAVDKRPSAYRDAIPGSRPAHVTRSMRMFQNHGSPSKTLSAQYNVLTKPTGFDIVEPSQNVLIDAETGKITQ